MKYGVLISRIFFIAAALILLTVYYCYRQVFYVSRKETLELYRLPRGRQYAERKEQMEGLIRQAAALPYEEVAITSWDGLTLYGKYYETSPKAPIQILFHGYRSNSVRDFSGGLQLALKSGYNAILVDQRGHGKSQGKCLSFGVLERRDCLSWIEYVNERFGCERPVALVGISMGATTVLMASELKLPENVKAIIADCGYTSPKEIIKKVMKDRRYPPSLTYPLVRLGARWFGHFDLEEISAQEALHNCHIPVLLIHGEADRFVPCHMSQSNYQACAGSKKLITIPEAGHGISYLVDEEGYCQAVKSFLDGIL
ncbi:MAG: alpha/beta hydrolase [Firmicutes bacterium]|nr:alpha/beta hydrolase [Bacillota bacterium]